MSDDPFRATTTTTCATCGAAVAKGDLILRYDRYRTGGPRVILCERCPGQRLRHPCPFLNACPPNGQTCAEHYAAEFDAHLARHAAERAARCAVQKDPEDPATLPDLVRPHYTADAERATLPHETARDVALARRHEGRGHGLRPSTTQHHRPASQGALEL